jgi:rhodanese-related sulfurtransferase
MTIMPGRELQTKQGGNFMQRRVVFLMPLLLVLFTSAIISCSQKLMKPMTAKDFVTEVSKEVAHKSLEESKAMFDDGGYVFLDCRDQFEYKKGHIPGAMNISRGLMEWKIEKKIPNKDEKIVMYCKSGGRSSLAAHAVQRMGYKNVVHFEGGWLAWVKAGYPVE